MSIAVSDNKNLAKRVMADIVSSPLVLMPFMVGSAAFASLFALGLKGSAALAATLVGLAGLLGSAGTFLTQFILGRDTRVKQLIEASRDKAKRDKRKAPDQYVVIQDGSVILTDVDSVQAMQAQEGDIIETGAVGDVPGPFIGEDASVQKAEAGGAEQEWKKWDEG